MLGVRSFKIVLGVAATGLLAGCHMHFHVVRNRETAAERLAAIANRDDSTPTNDRERLRVVSGSHTDPPQLLAVPPAARPLPSDTASARKNSQDETQVSPPRAAKHKPGLIGKLFGNSREAAPIPSVAETTVVLKINTEFEELPPAPRAVDVPVIVPRLPSPVDSRSDSPVKQDPVPKPSDPARLGLPPAPGVEGDDENAIQPVSESDAFPIDLPAALRLAGGQNLDVHLAAERVMEAQARLTGAEWMWLPSISLGASYTRHEGEIQGTTGEVINVNRNALFVGGGGRVGDAPLAGGGGGPARLFVDLSVTDAIYKPLVERQRVSAAQARHTAAYHETLESAAKAYFELVRAQGQAANATLDVAEGRELLQVITTFVAAGKGTQADITRMKTEVGLREQHLVDAEMKLRLASAELCRLLRIDPTTRLISFDERAIQVEMVSSDASLSTLVSQAVDQRPDLVVKYRELRATQQMEDAEFARPFLPNLYVGQSGGLFGGGPNSDLHSLDVRQDFDAMAVWEIKNFGVGVHSARRQAESRVRQAVFNFHSLRDTVKMEVAQAYHKVQAYSHKIRLAELNVVEALKSQEQQTARIRGMAGLPLESLASLKSVAETRTAYLNAIIDHNQAQVALLKAIGMSQEDRAAVPSRGISATSIREGAVHSNSNAINLAQEIID
ncbi:MAG: TolC family protein [Planctomycetota bacterium]|nr:TolC family protein [Planctomycetota bacterium]